MKLKATTKNIGVHVPRDLIGRIDSVRWSQGLDRSAWLRKAINARLHRDERRLRKGK